MEFSEGCRFFDRQKRSSVTDFFDFFFSLMCVGGRIPLTKVRLVGTPLQLHSFGAALNQEVPHELIGDVACNKSVGD